jgi:hypothetical protein
MPVEQQLPVVLAMILADTVLLDVATGKNTIQGTYRVLEAPSSLTRTQPSSCMWC